MSCESLNTQTVRMTVSAGALPEGFCPQSMQELFDAMVSRLIVTPNQTFTSFAAGPIEPTSNVGPWFKNCEEWFIWDDTQSRYVRMPVRGAFNALSVFNTTAAFTVPENITKIRVEAWGGGGGGANVQAGPSGGCGGAGAAYASGILTVLPGQTFTVTVGLGGMGGPAGADGTDSTVLTLRAGGGKGGPAAVNSVSQGGTYNGADYGVNGQCGMGGNTFNGGTGGNAGGGGGGAGVQDITGGCEHGIVPGGGGVGGLTSISLTGNGANGRVLIWY